MTFSDDDRMLVSETVRRPRVLGIGFIIGIVAGIAASAILAIGAYVVLHDSPEAARRREVTTMFEEAFQESQRIERVIESWGKPIESSGVTVRYRDSVDEATARDFLEFFTRQRSPAKNGETMTFGLDRAGNTYEVLISVKKGIDRDEMMIDGIRTFGTQLSGAVFDGAPVDMVLLDDVRLEPIRVVPCLQSP
jgi:hypothetical protein